jgi:hypothetical protein
MKKSSAKFFGKSLLALALGIIAVAGLAVAGILQFYGKVVGTATVQQSVKVDGNVCQPTSDNPAAGCIVTDTISGVAGDYIWSDADSNKDDNQPHVISNDASVTAEVTLNSYEADSSGNKLTSETTTVQEIKYFTAGDDGKCGTGDDEEISDVDSQKDGIQVTVSKSAPVNLCIRYKFPINAVQGTYYIVTEVIPAGVVS